MSSVVYDQKPSETPQSDVSAIICHYNPEASNYLYSLVLMCVATLQKTPTYGIEILVCDGSPNPDTKLAKALSDVGVTYLHAGKQLTFGETYNMGIQRSNTKYVVLIANDILITSEQVQKLMVELKNDVGCTIPFLTKSDYLGQVAHQNWVPRRSFPSSMTINVNVFRRDLLTSIGGVSEELSGGYNDILIFHQLRKQGYKIALINVGEVTHLAMATRKITSNFTLQHDLETATELYPDLFEGIGIKSKNHLQQLYRRCAQTMISKLMWRLLERSPWRLNQRKGLVRFSGWIEPYLTCDLSIYLVALRKLRDRVEE